jgi:hypothetical protein
MMVLFAILAGSSSVTLAQPELQPWSYLIGHCWAGEAPGNAGQDTHCFESVYGGQHVRDRHSVTVAGKEVYAGETLYSVHGLKVIFTYWNSLGGLGTGDASFKADSWRFSGTIHATATSTDETFSATWRKVSDGYEVIDAPGAKPRLFKRAD